MKSIVEKFAALITSWFILASSVIPLHEMCHVIAVRILGGDAYVSYSPGYIINSGFAHYIIMPDHHLWFVHLAGGLGVFLGCMILWFWARRSETLWDMHIELPCLVIGLMQLGYALVETFVFPTNKELFYEIYWVAYLVGALIALAIEWPRLTKWLRTEETISRKYYF